MPSKRFESHSQIANGLKQSFSVENDKYGPLHGADFYKNNTLSRNPNPENDTLSSGTSRAENTRVPPPPRERSSKWIYFWLTRKFSFNTTRILAIHFASELSNLKQSFRWTTLKILDEKLKCVEAIRLTIMSLRWLFSRVTQMQESSAKSRTESWKGYFTKRWFLLHFHNKLLKIVLRSLFNWEFVCNEVPENWVQ